MSDGITPVGAMVAPIKSPDVLGQLSSILGISQQRQQLQAQALQIQQDQIKTQAAQDTSNYFSSFDPTQYVTPNGTTDVTKIMASDPSYKNLTGAGKLQVTEALQKIQGTQLDNMGKMSTMDAQTVQDYSQGMGTLATDPDVLADNADGRSKLKAANDRFALRNAEAAKIAGIYGKAFALPDQGGAKQGHLGPAVAAIAAQAQTVSQQQAQSNPEQTSNAAGQIVNRNKATGALSTPPGSNDLINPSSTAVVGNTKRTTEAAGADFDRSNQVSNAVAPANQTVQLTQQVDDLADQIHTGKIADWVSKLAQAAGEESDTYARELLKKDLGKIQANASANAASDQRQKVVLSGLPEPTADSRTIHTAMDYTRGVARQDLARGALLNSIKSKDPNLRGFQHADDILTSSSDPLMHEFASLKTPAERSQFYRRNFEGNQKKMEDFRDKVAAMKHLNVIGQ